MTAARSQRGVRAGIAATIITAPMPNTTLPEQMNNTVAAALINVAAS